MQFSERVLLVTQQSIMPKVYRDMFGEEGERYYREWLQSPEWRETAQAENFAAVLLKNSGLKVRNINDKRTKVGRQLAAKRALYHTRFEKRIGIKLKPRENVLMTRILNGWGEATYND